MFGGAEAVAEDMANWQRAPKAPVRSSTFGDLTVTWREPMTKDDYDDMKRFVELWLRGVERRVANPTTTPNA